MTELQTKVFKTRIRGTIADVWREITKTDEVQGVMFNMKLDSSLEVGDRAHYLSPDGKYTGIVGEVLEFEAPRRYAHSFKFTNHEEPGCKVLHEVEGPLRVSAAGQHLTAILADLGFDRRG